LQAALDVEEERERATQKLEKKLQLAKLTYQEREKVWLDEMTQGILDNEVNERGGSDDEEGEGERFVLAKRPVRADDRKTKKQRRKERERKKEVRTVEGGERTGDAGLQTILMYMIRCRSSRGDQGN
jgi:hypothetical protein